MSNKTRIDRLLRHYKDPESYELTDDLEEYQERLDYCRDLLKRYDHSIVWRMMVKKFHYSRSSAYADIADTRQFFSNDFDKSERGFETVMAIERLQKLYDSAFATSKTPKDYYYCARIQQQINELKGLFAPEAEFDPRLIKPSVIQLVLPTGGRPKVIDVQNKDSFSQETIDLVEGMSYSIEDMKKQIEKQGDGSEDA